MSLVQASHRIVSCLCLLSAALMVAGCGTVLTYHVNLGSPTFGALSRTGSNGIGNPLPSPQLQLAIHRVLDARPDPVVVGKIQGGYSGPIGKIELTEGAVLSERLTRHVEAAIRASGYGVVSWSGNLPPQETAQAKVHGLLDVVVRDLTVEQFQEILPAFGTRVEARMLIEVSLINPSTGQTLWTRLIRGTASREHVIIPRNYWEPALNEAYAECFQQIQEALSSPEVRDGLIRQR